MAKDDKGPAGRIADIFTGSMTTDEEDKKDNEETKPRNPSEGSTTDRIADAFTGEMDEGETDEENE